MILQTIKLDLESLSLELSISSSPVFYKKMATLKMMFCDAPKPGGPVDQPLTRKNTTLGNRMPKL